MAAIYSNEGNRWNILGFNFTKRDALSSVYKISMVTLSLNNRPRKCIFYSYHYKLYIVIIFVLIYQLSLMLMGFYKRPKR